MRAISIHARGSGIIAKADDKKPDVYHWMAVVGKRWLWRCRFASATSDDPRITLNDPSLPSGVSYYLAVTYDGPSKTLILFVDGEQRGPKINPATYVPNTASRYGSGAGVPYVPLRPQAGCSGRPAVSVCRRDPVSPSTTPHSPPMLF